MNLFICELILGEFYYVGHWCIAQTLGVFKMRGAVGASGSVILLSGYALWKSWPKNCNQCFVQPKFKGCNVPIFSSFQMAIDPQSNLLIA